MAIDTSKWKMTPFKHQIDGVEALIKNPAFALFDEMGIGKSAQVVNSACILAERGVIDTVVIVAPASVRCVWLDKEIGEIRKHCWQSVDVLEFHQKTKMIWKDYELPKPHLRWIVTNYEFLRNSKHLEVMQDCLRGANTLLVLDESSYVKNRTAAQSKAVAKLRKHVRRCVLLNGTPVTNSPLDLYSQLNILDPKILNEDNFYSFRAKYAVLQQRKIGAMRFQEVVGYKDLDKLAKRVSPYVLRREKKDCLDLPEKLYTTREVALTPESWRRYCELKKDALLTLSKDNTRLEPNAAVRLMRLAQLTSGILGNVNLDQHGEPEQICNGDISDEKLRWAVSYLTEECTAKAVIVWCRWRRERERLYSALQKFDIDVLQIYGGQPKAEREAAVFRFTANKHSSLDMNSVLLAQPHAGGHGLNLVAASEAIYLSNDYSLGIRLQSEDRCHRPGQVNRVLYTDVLATGPAGQRTIDHIVVRALRDKKSVADMTTSEWRKELEND
jgi:SNF2 family DNA or RNA helicase